METIMANLFTRKDNNGIVKYYGNLRNNGKRVRKYLGLSKEVAQVSLKKLEYEMLFLKPTKAEDDIKIKEATISFLASLESSGISQRQVNSLHGKIKALLSYCNSKSIIFLKDITPKLANDFIKYRSNSRVVNKYQSHLDNFIPKLSPATLNKDIQTFKRFYNYCIDMHWIKSNPFINIKKFKNIPKQRYHFTTEDLELIMANAGKYYDFYYLLLHTGIRSTDAYHLKPEDIDGKYLKIQMNKTGDFLCIPIPKHVIDVLRPRMANLELFSTLNNDWKRSKCVKNIQRLFEPSFVRDNNINLHTFRHTYAHHMLNKGVPKEVLQTLLGHRSIKTTEIYANWVRKEELEKWV
jgi:integrase/recombinase XerD